MEASEFNIDSMSEIIVHMQEIKKILCKDPVLFDKFEVIFKERKKLPPISVRSFSLLSFSLYN